MNRRFSLRRATVEDIGLLLELRQAMWREATLDMDTTDAALALQEARKYLLEKMPSGEYICYLAEAEGRVVGVGGMFLNRHLPRPRSPRGVEGYILNMLTLPEWRRRGVASAIVRELLKCAREAGASLVGLRASEDGRPVYEKFGFRENPHYMQLELEASPSVE
jgi:GNAT superfamily N-acetyltransferase